MMYCMFCGYPLTAGAHFCINCGKSCDPQPASAPEIADPPFDAPQIPESAVPEAVPVKKHRPVLVPVLVMAVMFVVGFTCFQLLPSDADVPPETTAPVMQEDETGPSLPPHKADPAPSGQDDGFRSDAFVPADSDCFLMTSSGISFLPEKYDGGPVLVIPNEIDGAPVTIIADSGFADLKGITTVILPDSVEIIGANAFENCAELRGIYFPKTVKSIGARAFEGCIVLEAVSVPAQTVIIGSNAFDGCASLRYIFYDGTYEQWRELYNEYITPFTYAICTDGDYYHGVALP